MSPEQLERQRQEEREGDREARRQLAALQDELWAAEDGEGRSSGFIADDDEDEWEEMRRDVLQKVEDDDLLDRWTAEVRTCEDLPLCSSEEGMFLRNETLQSDKGWRQRWILRAGVTCALLPRASDARPGGCMNPDSSTLRNKKVPSPALLSLSAKFNKFHPASRQALSTVGKHTP